MDMFEPQDHPDDIPYPGATPTRPYDVAGYTLAFQMGVQFDRILDGFDGPFEKLTDFAKVPAGMIRGAAAGGRLLLQPQVQRQLHRDQPAARGRRRRVVAVERPDGPRHVLRREQADDARDSAEGRDRSGRELREHGDGADRAVSRSCASCASASFDTYGGGMPSGWTRLLLENFEFPFEVGVPADAGRRQSAREVRRARLQRRRPAWRRRRRRTWRWRWRGRGWRRCAAAGRRRCGRGRAAGAGAAAARRPGAGGAGRRRRRRGGGGEAARRRIRPTIVRRRSSTTRRSSRKRRGNVTAATMEQIKEFVNEGGTSSRSAAPRSGASSCSSCR